MCAVRDGSVILSKLMITPSFAGRPAVRLESPRYRFKGHLSIGNETVVLTLAGDGHDESLALVLNDPLTAEFELLTGIWAGVDGECRPTSGSVLIVKRERPLSYAQLTQPQCPRAVLAFLTTNGGVAPLTIADVVPPSLERLSKLYL